MTPDSAAHPPAAPGPEGERLRFERLITDLAARFLTVPAREVDAHIEDALRAIRTFLDMDRGWLFEFREGSSELTITHRSLGDLPRLPHADALDEYPWLVATLRRGEVIRMARIPDDYPPEAVAERRGAAQLGFRSGVTVPVKIGGRVIGAIAFRSHRLHREWPDELVQRLVIVSEIVASALERKRLDQELSQRLTFETLLTEISSSFANLPAERIDATVEAGLGRIVSFLQVDRAVLRELSADGTTLTPTHWADAVPDLPVPRTRSTDAYPYLLGLMHRGEGLRVARLCDLPAEAAGDRLGLEGSGIKSLLTIPVTVNGVLRCVLGLNMFRAERDWPDVLVPRLRLIAETFVNAVARKRVDEQLGQALAHVRALKDRLAAENIYLQEEIQREYPHDIVGVSDTLKYVLFRLEQVAATEATVLLLGETGTGKGLVARAIHARSRRRDRPLITVNCAALPATLVESELFGHERGAFTGAQARRPGRFELADGGTLFLDEVGDLPLELQAKLLRVLQDGEFERLGSPRTLRVDVRVIAATNRALKAEVQAGRFRQDLYYRLNVFPISLPALRERRGDVPLLARHLVARCAMRLGRAIDGIPPSVMAALEAYDWPGNIRELENVIERAVIISPGPALQLAEPLEAPAATATAPASPTRLTDLERQHIVEMLERAGWMIEGPKGAAAALGINASTLRSRMRKLGIQRA